MSMLFVVISVENTICGFNDFNGLLLVVACIQIFSLTFKQVLLPES